MSSTDLTFLIVGLGSMGKRRIRCLNTLGHKNVLGVDRRSDRREEAATKYGIATFATIDEAMKQKKPDAMIISVPPDAHHLVMKRAIQERLPFFVEASVVDTDMEEVIRSAEQSKVLACPSSTMIFHPGVQIVAGLVKSGELGTISNVLHHSGQWLPDWHTYEKVSEYYVSNKATGGAREIVPFELSWLTLVFGFPKHVCGHYRKTVKIEGAETIDDTYNCCFDYGSFLMSMTVDVVSRHAVRRCLINGDRKQLVWDWDDQCVKVFDPKTEKWSSIPYSSGQAAGGYNANIGEAMYIEEIRNFVQAIRGEAKFVNTLPLDHAVLKLLYAVEQANDSGRYVEVKL